MTYLGYGYKDGAIYIAQDTIVSSVKTNKPFFCIEKMVYFKNLNCIIAGTGDLRLQFNAWISAWNSESIEELSIKLRQNLSEYRKNAGNLSSDNLVPSTVFVFYFENENPKGLRFTFADQSVHEEILDISENLVEGKVAYKPEVESIKQDNPFRLRHKKTLNLIKSYQKKSGLENELALYGLLTHLGDCSSRKPTGIGGELILFSITANELSMRKKLFTYPDNQNHGSILPLLSPDEALEEINKPSSD